MTSVNEITIEGKDNMHYYDPKENTNVSLVLNEVYPMHIESVDIREVSVKGKYKAKVYNPRYVIAKECSQRKYNTVNGEVSGSAFVDKQIYGTGIFMFLTPKEGDTFEANNGANDRYLAFCEAINIKCPEVEIEVDGEKRMVKQFPELSKEDIIGKPILGKVMSDEYTNQEGEKKMSYKVKQFTGWKDGKSKDMDGLPF